MANIAVPYEDFARLCADSADKENAIQILKTKFPDDTCQIVALKAVFGIEEEVESPDTTDPADPIVP